MNLPSEKADELRDLLEAYKKHESEFYFDAEVAPGVAVEFNWEDNNLGVVLVRKDAEGYEGPFLDSLTELGDLKMFEDLEDDLCCLVDRVFRTNISQFPTPGFRFTPEWSTETHDMYVTDISVRRDPLRA